MLPLDDIRVLEVAREYPGPYCGLLLGDLGAEVIKVERPGAGDPVRQLPSFFQSINRNKKSITVDFKADKGREIFYKLAESSDAIVEGFRPGVAERLEIDYERIKRVNPEIIYCSITGFGQDGPYKDRSGHDINYVSYSGVLGASKYTSKDELSDFNTQIGDLSSGMFAAISVLAALHARERSGEGQFIDVSMLDGLVSWMSCHIGMFQGSEGPYGGGFLAEVPVYDVFKAKDEEYITLGIPHEDHFWHNLCEVLGWEDMADFDLMERLERKEEIGSKLEAAFKEKSRDEWTELLSDADIPFAPVYSIDEVMRDPQVLHRDMVVEVELPKGKKIKQTGIPVKFSKTPGKVTSPPPSLGQHTEEILLDLGYDKGEISELRRSEAV